MPLVQEAGGQVELMNLPGDLLDFSKPAAVFSACGSCFEEAREIARRFCPKGAAVNMYPLSSPTTTPLVRWQVHR